MITEKEERQVKIIATIQENGKAKVSALAKKLDVTTETIRRDLAELEERKQLSRVHGGAIPFVEMEKELAFKRKMGLQKEEKIRIAREAVQRIENGDLIAVDVGTTTVYMADMIDGLENITVVTNSIAAAERFNLALEEKRMTGKVLLLGGFTNPEQSSVAGTMTLNMLEQFNINKAFLSSGGITRTTVYDYDFEEASISAKMLSKSSRSIMLADSTKIGVTSHMIICPLLALDEVITDIPCPKEWEHSISEHQLVWTTV